MHNFDTRYKKDCTFDIFKCSLNILFLRWHISDKTDTQGTRRLIVRNDQHISSNVNCDLDLLR